MNLSTMAETDFGTVLGMFLWIGAIVFGIVKHAKQQAAKNAAAAQADLAATNTALHADRALRPAEDDVPMAIVPMADMPEAVALEPTAQADVAVGSLEAPVEQASEGTSARRRLSRVQQAILWREVFQPPMSMRDHRTCGGAL